MTGRLFILGVVAMSGADMAELDIKVVRESAGRPVARTELIVSGGSETASVERKVKTDAFGLASTRLPLGDYHVYPTDPAFAAVCSTENRLPQTDTMPVPLPPACAMSGSVVDHKGQPLGGSRLQVWADFRDLELYADERGQFTVGRLSASEHTVTAYAAGHATGTLAVPLRSGEHRKGVTVVLQRGATLAVTAACGTDACAGTRVKVLAPGDDYREADVEADCTAAFRDLPPGEVKIRAVRNEANPGELASLELTSRLAPGDAAAVTVALAPTGGHATLRGSVVSKSGRPLEAAIEASCGAVRRYAMSEPDGSFVVQDLPEGPRCRVLAGKDGVRVEVDADGRAPLRLVIDSPLNP